MFYFMVIMWCLLLFEFVIDVKEFILEFFFFLEFFENCEGMVLGLMIEV